MYQKIIVKMLVLGCLFFQTNWHCLLAQNKKNNSKKTESGIMKTTEQRIEELLKQMTLEEKVGQLNLKSGDVFFTGPTVNVSGSSKQDEMIAQGKVGGLFNLFGTDYIRRMQKIALEKSRLKIPLLFGADVIHGFRTVFPIPLAEVASWDMDAVEKSARITAIEATAAGINWNFAPMVDVTRDPRWGRISEGAGEDPYLGSLVAKARVKGFQGTDLKAPNTLAACVKHFAGYGQAFGGRDYNPTDMSDRMLREIYLPPFKAAIDAKVATLMTSFNELNGVPASGNAYLTDQILRKEWGFKGMVVSDYASMFEMIAHGIVADETEATKLGLETGTDMDMEGNLFLNFLPALIQQGKVDTARLNNAVRNVLRVKFDLGLFDNPYLYCDAQREKNEIFSLENQKAALDVAKKSIVLLKNQNNLLPLAKNTGTIALIGPLATNQVDLNGCWSFFARNTDPITILQGIKSKVSPQTKVLTAIGCEFYNNSTQHFAEAVKIAQQADVVVMALGESAVMNGEAGSRSNLDLPGVQLDLLKEIHKTGKPVIVLLQSGRPLCIEWLDENIPAILATWTLGTQAGNAIAEVLFGDYNPSGKLPVTFPRNVGQIPIFYSHKHTGRPYVGDYKEPETTRIYLSKYRDTKNSPLYAFGHGLSYTTFEYGNIQLDKTTIGMNETLNISIKISNTGKYAGEEVVQLYIRDLVGSVTRPVKELKGFKKINLKAGESQEVKFTLNKEDLSFYRFDMSWGAEPGKFKVFVGTSSDKVKEADFQLVK
jgi:beta-glucosidase